MTVPRLSLTMIVRDEETTIGRVLFQTAEFCDEQIVVDTGSTDRTRAIAEAAGATVLDFTWIDDFAAARNHALAAASGDWVLWLDADDVVTAEVKQAMGDVKQSVLGRHLDAVHAPYRYSFDDAGRCTLAFPRERLVRRVDGLRWVGAVHEVLHIPGDQVITRDDLYIERRPVVTSRSDQVGRNLGILQKAVDSGDRNSRTLLYFARELHDHARHAEAYDAFAEYLDDPGVDWEKHGALIQLADSALKLGRIDDARARLFEALSVDARRVEPFLVLGNLHFEQQQWAHALPWYAAAAAMWRPPDGFTQPADYGWRPWDFLSVCLINVGRYDEGIVAGLKALELGAPDTDRLRQNLKWALDQVPATARQGVSP